MGVNCCLIALNLCDQKDTMIFRQKLSLPWTVSRWSLRPAGLYTTGYYLISKRLAHHLKRYCLLWQRGPLFGCIGMGGGCMTSAFFKLTVSPNNLAGWAKRSTSTWMPKSSAKPGPTYLQLIMINTTSAHVCLQICKYRLGLHFHMRCHIKHWSEVIVSYSLAEHSPIVEATGETIVVYAL